MKKECEIARDLLPSYVENLESKSTKEFVEEHISSCLDCKSILDSIQKDKLEEIKKSSIEKDIEIKNIKKYRKKNIRVRITILLLIVIAVIFASILFRYAYNTNIILGAYNRIQELKNSNNIKIVVEEHQIAYGNKEDVKDLIIKTEWYCKDGKYKKKLYSNQSENDTQVFYGTLNSDEYYYVDKSNQIINDKFNQPITIDYILFTFTDIFNAKQGGSIISKMVNMLCFDVKTKTYNEKECYVLRKSSDSGYNELWIDKETMTQVRSINETFGKYYYENIYKLELNSVSNEDVDIPNID